MSNETCDELGCDLGWIHHQHPLKPSPVIMNSTPCPRCNADGKEPNPFHADIKVRVLTAEEVEAWRASGPPADTTYMVKDLDLPTEESIKASIKEGFEAAERIRKSGGFGPGAGGKDWRYR